jgi:DNA primase
MTGEDNYKADDARRQVASSIRRVLSTTNLADVIGRYTHLQENGLVYEGPCTLYGKKKDHPLAVNPATNEFRCKTCRVQGDAIDFFQNAFDDTLDFFDGYEQLCRATGTLSLPPPPSMRAEGLSHVLLQAAADFYRLQLAENLTAQAYLQERGVSDESVAHWKLGYAPNGNGMYRSLLRQAFWHRDIFGEGLVKYRKARNEPALQEHFQDRIMFPLHDQAGTIVGFAGRALDPNRTPKYLNSPSQVNDTPTSYNKREILYGLHHAREAIKAEGFARLIEGYFDTIIPHQMGIKNVVGPAGTSFTVEQAKVLRQFTNRVAIAYDPDRAGIKATFRAARVAYGAMLEPFVIALPPGMDPDVLVRTHGKEALTGIEGQSIFSFVETAYPPHIVADMSLDERVRTVRLVGGVFASMHDPLVGLTALGKIAEILQVPRMALEEAVTEALTRERNSRELPAQPDLDAVIGQYMRRLTVIPRTFALDSVENFLPQAIAAITKDPSLRAAYEATVAFIQSPESESVMPLSPNESQQELLAPANTTLYRTYVSEQLAKKGLPLPPALTEAYMNVEPTELHSLEGLLEVAMERDEY